MIPLTRRPAHSYRIGELAVWIATCNLCRRSWKIAASTRPSSTPEHRCLAPSTGFDELQAAGEGGSKVWEFLMTAAHRNPGE